MATTSAMIANTRLVTPKTYFETSPESLGVFVWVGCVGFDIGVTMLPTRLVVIVLIGGGGARGVVAVVLSNVLVVVLRNVWSVIEGSEAHIVVFEEVMMLLSRLRAGILRSV
jgi:hypothetical protein